MNNDQVEALEYGFASLVFCFGAIWLRLKQITHEDEAPVKVIPEPETNVGPYRTSAPKPQEYIEERDALLDSIKQIVNKKDHHMNEKLKKILKIAVSVSGLCICSVIIGAVNDTSWGAGLKLGIQLGLVPFGIAFFIAAVSIAMDEF